MTQAPSVSLDEQPANQPVEVSEVQLPEATDNGARQPAAQLDIILDTSVTVSVTLGEVQMPARDVLQVGPGAVVQLNKVAGEPLDLFMNGVRFATGQLVVVGEQLGVRITEILNPEPPAPDREAS